MVWEWVNPFAATAVGMRGYWVFQAWWCGEDHPASAGRELDAGALAGFNRRRGVMERGRSGAAALGLEAAGGD